MSDDDWSDYYFWGSGNDAKTSMVVEKDEVQLSSILGPDGKPYAIRRPKMQIGFDLSAKKS